MKTVTMATEENVHSYFSSINSLAKKIMEEKEKLMRTYGEDWNQLSFDKQEEILDNYIVDSTVREKYKDFPEQDDLPEYFPKLVVNSGEKIYVDFENDGWTWQDEHSGPFSWETKSQMNFQMDGSDEAPKKTPRKKRPLPSENGSNGNEFAYKPEKSIWDSPFLAADRGLDSGYPSSQASEEQSKVSERSDDKPDSDDILQNFGLNFSNNSDNTSTLDDSKEEDEVFEYSDSYEMPKPPPRRISRKEKKEVVPEKERSVSEDRKKDNGFLAELTSSVLKNRADDQNSDQNGSEVELFSGTPKRNSGKFRRSPSKEKEKKKDKETVKYSHLSEIDDIPRSASYDGPAAEEESLVLDEDQISTLTSDLSLDLEKTKAAEEIDEDLSSSPPKTGFDFLDNW